MPRFPTSPLLQGLKTRLNNNRHEIECDNSYEMVSVRSLIDDVLGPDSRMPQSASQPEVEGDRYNQGNSGGTNFQTDITGQNITQGQNITYNYYGDDKQPPQKPS